MTLPMDAHRILDLGCTGIACPGGHHSTKEHVMENLFRMVLTRPAVLQNPDAPSIPLEQNSPFQLALQQAQQAGNLRASLKGIARQFVSTPGFVADPKSLAVFAPLQALALALDTLQQKKTVSNTDLIKAIEEAFGKKIADIIRNKELDTPLTAIRDTLLAIKLLPEEHMRPIDQLTNLLRDGELILKANASKDFPGSGAALRRYRKRSALRPGNARLGSALSTQDRQKQLDQQRKRLEEARRKEAETKLALYQRLSTAITELTKLSGDHLQTTPQKADGGFLLPAQSRPTQLAVQEFGQQAQLAKLDLQRLQSAVDRGTEIARITQPNTAPVLRDDTSHARSLSLQFLVSRGAFTPLAKNEYAFRLQSSAAQALSAPTQELLKHVI
jgi:hypothetical protein